MQPPPPQLQAAPAAPLDPTEALTRAEQAAQAKRANEAMGICRDVLEAHPEHPGALALLGSLLGHKGEIAESIALLERACARNNNVPAWHNNLCSLYRMECRLDEAEKEGRAALALAPNTPLLLLNLAKVYMDRGDLDTATNMFMEVLAREPQHPEAHLAIGQMLLAKGDMQPGWAEYEWRNRLEQARGMIPDMIRPEWNGMNLPNGTIMLIGDQGFGDTLQFARFIPAVAARCKEVTLACGGELEALIGRLPGVSRSFTKWQDAPAHTVWCRLTSLGILLNATPETIPAAPYVSANTDAVGEWSARLSVLLPRRRPRVGLFWAGRPTHPNDRRRSLRLAQLAPLTEQREVDFISIQKVVPDADRATMAAIPNMIDLSAALADFSTTAAVMANLDLLVTVDSAVGHLAGSLGRPVTMLSATPADWRWGLTGEATYWYPSMRILRQTTPGEWQQVIRMAADQVRNLGQHMVPEREGAVLAET
jgi:Tetratricopeptide repeat/Glycosyltransferase family 9 (heptosyltransferase)